MTDKDGSGKSEEFVCGTATVGERGQIVIPADLRKDLELHTGDKLLVCKHPSGKGIMLFPVDTFREFMDKMLITLQRVEGEK